MTALQGIEAESRRIAATYPPEAATTPRRARERHFTPAQRLAWEIRFGTPESADAMRLAIEDTHL